MEAEHREAVRRAALQTRLDQLVAKLTTKKDALQQRGFSFRERVDEKKGYYGLLLSAGRRRISVTVSKEESFSVSVYIEGVREPDGFQTIINNQTAEDQDALMAILGDWIIRYGSLD